MGRRGDELDLIEELTERKTRLSTKEATDRAVRLLNRGEADRYLGLSNEQFQLLINTRQITVIRIQGEERFDIRDLDRLIETYKATAQRRAS